MVFDILKRYIVGTQREQFFEKKSLKKMKKTVQNLYISSFLGTSKRSPEQAQKKRHTF